MVPTTRNLPAPPTPTSDYSLQGSQKSTKQAPNYRVLTHWGRETYICVVKLTIIGSDNGLSPGRRQAIIWTNAGILLIGPLGTNFIEILIGIQSFSFKKMHLKMSSAKWRPFCLGLNVLNEYIINERYVFRATIMAGREHHKENISLLNFCLNEIKLWWKVSIDSSPPGQNGRHFTDDIFRCIFVNEKFCILIKILLKFFPKGLINNKPALV